MPHCLRESIPEKRGIMFGAKLRSKNAKRETVKDARRQVRTAGTVDRSGEQASYQLN
jgi:hypothetical protein